jgi:hypothetical protein
VILFGKNAKEPNICAEDKYWLFVQTQLEFKFRTTQNSKRFSNGCKFRFFSGIEMVGPITGTTK